MEEFQKEMERKEKEEKTKADPSRERNPKTKVVV